MQEAVKTKWKEVSESVRTESDNLKWLKATFNLRHRVGDRK